MSGAVLLPECYAHRSTLSLVFPCDFRYISYEILNILSCLERTFAFSCIMCSTAEDVLNANFRADLENVVLSFLHRVNMVDASHFDAVIYG